MEKTAGTILGIGGFIGVIYFLYRFYEESESFNVFGADVTISTGDVVPIIISALVMVVGFMMARKHTR